MCPSGQYRSAVAVREHATPELIDAVEQGKIAVSVAAGLATAPKAVQRQAVADPDRAHVLVKQSRRAQRESELGQATGAYRPGDTASPTSTRLGKFEVDSEDFAKAGRLKATIRSCLSGSTSRRFRSIPSPTTPCSVHVDNIADHAGSLRPLEGMGVCLSVSMHLETKEKFGLNFALRNQHAGSRGPSLSKGTNLRSGMARNGQPRSGPRAADIPRSLTSSYELIEAYFPTLPKIELFARGKARPGWTVWGNEAETECEA